MTLDQLASSNCLILGLGLEGIETYKFLRARFPTKNLGVADRLTPSELPAHVRNEIAADPRVVVHFGPDYLSNLNAYDVLIRSPGISLSTAELHEATGRGVCITSHTEIFLANCKGTIIGVTGTKGKSTTASLVHALLREGGIDCRLVGNVGRPALSFLTASEDLTYVYELSSFQLDGLRCSPHIAVLLNIVPEHLDYHENFERYVRAKNNIARFQRADDILVYNAMYSIPKGIAQTAASRKFAFSTDETVAPGSFLDREQIVYSARIGERDIILNTSEVPLLGRFNLQNVLPAITVAKILGVASETIARGVRTFKPLKYRLEYVGTYRGIRFYDDPLATVPEATVAALDSLGPDAWTVLLGGQDRGVDMSALARRLRQGEIKVVILFPESGRRILEAIEREYKAEGLPAIFFVEDMRSAVRLAFLKTPAGKICLHSPASPSFGLFRNYSQRGDSFRNWLQANN